MQPTDNGLIAMRDQGLWVTGHNIAYRFSRGVA